MAPVSFGSLSDYSSGGFTLAEGNYGLEFEVVMFQATDRDGNAKGEARLGVQITAHPLAGGDPQQQFYSMGTKAHESFAPNPDTGKGIVAIEGGAGKSLSNQSNWALLLKSFYDSGLPEGVFTDDLSVLDGVHVHMQQVPEPESRKQISANTGDVEQEKRKPGLVAIVTEIMDDGKPWEGTGGIPTEKPKAKAKTAAKAAPKAAPKAKAAPVVTDDEDEDTETVATAAIAEVLEDHPKGLPKLNLRTTVFKSVSTKKGATVAQDVAKVFNSDATLNGLLAPLGFKVSGTLIVTA